MDENLLFPTVNLGAEEKILVVGGRDTNYKPEHWNNSRIVFWQIEKNSEVPDKIPCKVVVVIFSRFLSHAIKEKVVRVAKTSGVKFYPICRNTGEIRRVIDKLLQTAVSKSPFESSKTEETKEMEEKTLGTEGAAGEEEKKRAIGVVKFIKDNANFKAKPSEEIKRLFEIAVANGINTTESSIRYTFYKSKRDLLKKSATSPKREKDSVDFLEQFVEQIELAAVAIRELIEFNKKITTENSALRREMEEMSKLKKILKKISL